MTFNFLSIQIKKYTQVLQPQFFHIEFSWMDPDLQQKEFGSTTLLPFQIPNLFWIHILYLKLHEPVAYLSLGKKSKILLNFFRAAEKSSCVETYSIPAEHLVTLLSF